MARALGLTIFLLLIACNVLTLVQSARLLGEVESQPQVVPDAIPQPNPAATTVPPNPGATAPQLPSGQIPAVSPESDDDTPVTPVKPVPNPTATGNANGPGPVVGPSVTAATNPIGGPGSIAGPGAANPASVGAAGPAHEPTLAFFMHDVLGGFHPSARVVTGIIAQTEINGIPFSKANNNIFPVDNGIPLVNLNNINKVINPNNAPLLTGLNGAQANTIIQTSSGNNNALGNNLPFVTAGQLPPGAALQQLMFGSITVVDDELTEGHELGSAVIGRAQGFYLASSLDGTSQTLALTVLCHGDHDHHDTVDDAISFFGVHRTAALASQIAVVGGTGKYEHAKGYAVVETLHNQENQHVTDGVDTILHFSVYLTYYKA